MQRLCRMTRKIPATGFVGGCRPLSLTPPTRVRFDTLCQTRTCAVALPTQVLHTQSLVTRTIRTTDLWAIEREGTIEQRLPRKPTAIKIMEYKKTHGDPVVHGDTLAVATDVCLSTTSCRIPNCASGMEERLLLKAGGFQGTHRMGKIPHEPGTIVNATELVAVLVMDPDQVKRNQHQQRKDRRRGMVIGGIASVYCLLMGVTRLSDVYGPSSSRPPL